MSISIVFDRASLFSNVCVDWGFPGIRDKFEVYNNVNMSLMVCLTNPVTDLK